MHPVPEALRYLLTQYCNVNAPEMVETLRDAIRRGTIPAGRAEAIRAALRQAILGSTLSPEAYKRLTGDNECTTPAAVTARLREIHGDVFPGEPLPGLAA